MKEEAMIRMSRIFFNISFAAFILMSAHGEANHNDCMRDFPLFDYRAAGNNLPGGDYVMIRSFREITQIILCRNYYQVKIYTDRNNMKDGEITASGYSGFDQVISEPAIPSQLEFNSMLKEYTLYGLTEGAEEVYRGVIYYQDLLTSPDTLIERYADEYLIRFNSGKYPAEITLDQRWKKLVIRRVKGETEASICPSVYIDQTMDKTLKRIITEFAFIIKKRDK